MQEERQITINKRKPKLKKLTENLLVSNVQLIKTNFEQNQNYLLQPKELLEVYARKELGNIKKFCHFRFDQKWNDPRIQIMKHSYFHNKKVLDIGCGQGMVTLQIAIKFFPKLIKGIDIDKLLINQSTKNTQFFISKNNKQHQPLQNEPVQLKQELSELLKRIDKLPQCFRKRLQYENGGVQSIYDRLCSLTNHKILKVDETHQEHIESKFPKNIEFKVENIFLINQPQKYDTILVFSLVKCIHLIFGDKCVLKLFSIIYKLLQIDGLFIFQYHHFKSYKKDKSKHPQYQTGLKEIKIKPQKFKNILINMGFDLVQIVQPDKANINSIKKPIAIFRKLK